MVNYGNSMIYKLCCKDPNITDIYIGSTTNFSRRKAEHKRKSNDENNKEYNYYKYQFIRDNGSFQNWDMILIENVNVHNKRDLLKIERKWIDELKPSLNMIKSYITEDEKKEYKKEYLKEYNKEYNKNHKTEISEKKKEHYENNKEHYTQIKKEWYEKNKNEILEKRKEKINCEFCNCLVRKSDIKKHQNTIKCKAFQFIDN